MAAINARPVATHFPFSMDLPVVDANIPFLKIELYEFVAYRAGRSIVPYMTHTKRMKDGKWPKTNLQRSLLMNPCF